LLRPPHSTLFPYTTLFRSRLRRQGKEGEAVETWKRLIAAYKDVPAERPWVRRAEQALEGKGAKADPEYQALREALSRAKKLDDRSEEHTSELQSRFDLVCR